MYAIVEKTYRRPFTSYVNSAEIAVMGAQGAVEILFRKDKHDVALMKKHKENYEKKFSNPFVAAELGYIDDIITPRETR